MTLNKDKIQVNILKHNYHYTSFLYDHFRGENPVIALHLFPRKTLSKEMGQLCR
jgi:hypothetical protein